MCETGWVRGQGPSWDCGKEGWMLFGAIIREQGPVKGTQRCPCSSCCARLSLRPSSLCRSPKPSQWPREQSWSEQTLSCTVCYFKAFLSIWPYFPLRWLKSDTAGHPAGRMVLKMGVKYLGVQARSRYGMGPGKSTIVSTSVVVVSTCYRVVSVVK